MTIVEHEELYLEDGDVVLWPPPNADGKTTLFRVHRSVLASNSPFFETMFSLPGDPSVQEIHDGVPVIRVQDDASLLSLLLLALYQSEYVGTIY